jgi:hypothetical protein
MRLPRALAILVITLLLLAPTGALADVTLVVPDGVLVPGRPNRLLVVLHRDGQAITEALPAVAADHGRVELAQGRIRDGVYSYLYLAPADASGSVNFTIGTGSGGIKRVRVPLARLPLPVLEGPAQIEVMAGEGATLQATFTGDDPPAPEEVVAHLSEGTVVEVALDGEGNLTVRAQLGPERYPRVALLGVHDLRYPDHPPAWVPVRVIGRPRIPVRTEPGASVTLSVGRRSYGPFVADERGVAMASIAAWPGEETATVAITDPSGNVQHSTLNLTRENQPLLDHMAAPARPGAGAPMAPVYLAALDPYGRPWLGASPRCTISPEGGGEIVPHGPGRYVLVPVPPQDEAFLDLRVDCSIPDSMASTHARLPMGEGIPDHLLLRLYPSALSADFPVAQVQVLLEDRLGERIDASEVEVGAKLGSVSVDRVEGGALRGEYNGAEAGGVGADLVWARFQRPAGSGPVSLVRVGHGAPRDVAGTTVLPVHGRALDARGRPLEGVALTLSLGERSTIAYTDARGWASAELEAPSGAMSVLECRYRDRRAREPYLPSSPGGPLDLGLPDLRAEVEVPITAGRVREVFIDTMPAVLHSGPSAVARVRVRLVDRHGNAVTDETIRVTADVGEVGALRVTADGTYEAWYRPPPELRAGTVQLKAHSQEGAVVGATKLELLPKPLSKAATLSLGALSNLGGIHSPLLELNVEARLFEEPGWVLLRGSLGYYYDRQVVLDELTGEEISFYTSFFPATLAASMRHERGLSSFSIGAGLVLLTYSTESRFGDSPGTAGMGLGGPGLSLHSGIARRIGIGELCLEGRYILVSTRAGGFDYDGPVGGIALLPGYRVLF